MVSHSQINSSLWLDKMKITPWSLLLLPLFWLPGSALAEEEAVAMKKQLASLSSVSVQSLASLVIHPKEDVSATVISLHRVFITPEISGKIVEMVVEVGDHVEKGQVVARLDPWLYQAQLRQAQGLNKELKVALNLAKREQSRAQKLRKKGQSTEAVLDTKKGRVDQLKAQLISQNSRVTESGTRLGKSVIKAPFSGVISQRTGEIGGWVGVASPLVELVDLRGVELVAHLDQRQIKQLENGSELSFIHGDRPYPVTVRTRLAIENRATKTQEMRFSFSGDVPPPGASGRLNWQHAGDHLPPWLLVRRKGALGLFLVKEKKAVFLPLPSAKEGIPALLPAGISGEVAIDGRESLKEGESLLISPVSSRE
jgi:RND family efflux transporter MFP subunit